jgi:hypothetical protein
MTDAKLAPCPACGEPVHLGAGHYREGNWIWPSVRCQNRKCNFSYQPVRYPWSDSDLATEWNRLAAPRPARRYTQEETAAWMGVDVATMNLAHDCLHHALCDAFKVRSQAMRQAAGEPLFPAEQHLADLEENAVLHVQRWLHAAGVL